MEQHHVDDTLTVAPQPKVEDLAALARQGFAAVICNRPDGEEEGQADAATMRAAAEAAGLAFHHIPTASGQYNDACIAAFRAVRKGTDGPVFAYCRTGTRSISLETLANPNDLPAAERLLRARDAGYDLASLSERIGA